jgi:hypothetical protein
MKAEGRTLRETLKSPMFSGRPVEVSLLGGLASFRVGGAVDRPQLETGARSAAHQLEDGETIRQRELLALLDLLEKNAISFEEYRKAKREIMNK